MQIKVPDAILSDCVHHILKISCTQADRGDFARRFVQGGSERLLREQATTIRPAAAATRIDQHKTEQAEEKEEKGGGFSSCTLRGSKRLEGTIDAKR